MSQDAKKTHSFEGEDGPLAGSTLVPPFALLALGAIEIGWGIYTNFEQVSTSTLAFLGLMAGQAVLGADKSAHHMLALMPQFQGMSFTIAFGVQIFMVSNAQPISAIYQRLRIIHYKHNLASAAREVSSHLTLRQYIAIAAFVGDVVGDILYSTSLTGAWFPILMWAVFLSASSTIILLDGLQRFWGGIRLWIDFKAHYMASQPRKAASNA